MWDEDLITTYEKLLECVDEYTLYSFYLGFAPEPDMLYRSPIREGDLSPSWSMFMSRYRKNVEFMWKDKGGGGISGDIWGLIKHLYGISTMAQVLARVKSDFQLGPEVAGERMKLIEFMPPVASERIDIRVQSRDLDRFDLNWWKGINVDKPLLERFHISRIRYYFKVHQPAAPRCTQEPGLCLPHHGALSALLPLRTQAGQVPQRADRQGDCVGFEQLTYSTPLLIVTKSYKDVACISSFGYDCISPRSESYVLIPPEFMEHFRREYKVILFLYDNDGKHNGHLYPEPKIGIPLSSGTKDPTDFCCKYGPHQTDTLLKQPTDVVTVRLTRAQIEASSGHEAPW